MTKTNVIPFAPPADSLIERIGIATEQLRDVPPEQIAAAIVEGYDGQPYNGADALMAIAVALSNLSVAANHSSFNRYDATGQPDDAA